MSTTTTRALRALIGAIAALFAALAFAGPTAAATNFDNAPQGAHYANRSSEPVCTVDGTTVTCTGTQIAGVGNTNATVELAVTTSVTGYCHNPGTNSKIVDPFTESDTASTSTDITSTKNGRLVVPEQSTTAPSAGDLLEGFSCPNPNWTPEITGTSFSYLYTLTFAGFTEPAIVLGG